MKPNENELKMVELTSTNGQNNEPLSIIPLHSVSAEISDKNASEKHTAEESEYDPHKHGNKVRPVYRIEATLLLLKYIVGAGILAIPYSFRNVGYLVGIIGTIFISLLYLHIVHLLLELEYDLCKRIKAPQLTYVGVVKQTFDQSSIRVRPMKPYFVAMIYFNYGFSNILFNSVCLITMAGDLHNIFSEKKVSAGEMQYYLTLIIIPLTLICWIPNLKFLVPFSVMTCVLTLVNVIIILFIGTNQVSEVTHFHAIGDLWQFPSFFAIVLGAFSCTGLILPLKNDMAKPKLLTSKIGVLNISILLVSVMYSIFGITAYSKYGDQTQGNVLSNLPRNHNIFSMFVYISYTIAMGISFAYSFYISFDTLWANYLGPKLEGKKYECLIKYSMKTLINVVTYGFAVGIPNFELFATLSGSLGILMDVGLPPMLQNLLFVKDKLTVSKGIIILKNSLIILMSFVLFCSSLYSSLKDLVELYKD
ncbi:hypothetical protein V9T40_012998 [Parthenolecanium corni]|uniref:Amino acid transporter transmembrane domain-containing protein n=1 Tax=Parthenolecanium corni TaxID=536013 RepID=A0AAN9T8B3_9HEMI